MHWDTEIMPHKKKYNMESILTTLTIPVYHYLGNLCWKTLCKEIRLIEHQKSKLQLSYAGTCWKCWKVYFLSASKTGRHHSLRIFSAILTRIFPKKSDENWICSNCPSQKVPKSKKMLHAGCTAKSCKWNTVNLARCNWSSWVLSLQLRLKTQLNLSLKVPLILGFSLGWSTKLSLD